MLQSVAMTCLAIITDGTTPDTHTDQTPTVAFIDLHLEVLLPAFIAICVTTLHGCGFNDRHITEATLALNLSRLSYCTTNYLQQDARYGDSHANANRADPDQHLLAISHVHA